MSRLLLMSSGHGYGHAARDLRIVKAIRSLRRDVHVAVASYGSGLELFRNQGEPCDDLGFTDSQDRTGAANWLVWRYLAKTTPPDLVVSDEIMAALPFCKNVLDVDCVLLTDWFPSDTGRPEADRLFNIATEVLVLDFAAAHQVPAAVTAPVRFTGPVFLDLPAAPSDIEVRDGLTAVVSLGGRPDRAETQAMLDRLEAAWRTGSGPGDRLYVLAPPRPGEPGPRVVYTGLVAEPHRYYRTADVVVTDAMGFTSCDLIPHRIPVLAMTDPATTAAFPASFGRRVAFLEQHGLLATAGSQVTGDDLWKLIVATATRAQECPPRDWWTRPEEIAAHLLQWLPDRSG